MRLVSTMVMAEIDWCKFFNGVAGEGDKLISLLNSGTQDINFMLINNLLLKNIQTNTFGDHQIFCEEV